MSDDRVSTLRRKIKKLDLELKKNIDKLNELEREKNTKNVEKFIGKYLARELGKSFESYFYVFGINDRDSSGRSLVALSVTVVSSSWFIIEETTIYPDSYEEKYYQITGKEFFEKVKEVKPFLDFLMKGLETLSKEDLAGFTKLKIKNEY